MEEKVTCNLSVPEGGKETTIEEEMKTAEEVIEIDTTEVTTTWAEAAAPTLIEVHQEAIEVVAEICHIVRMAVDHPEITMVTVITHTALIDTAIMNPEAKEETDLDLMTITEGAANTEAGQDHLTEMGAEDTTVETEVLQEASSTATKAQTPT